MALNARRRPLVTDGESRIDQLRGKIEPSNNRNNRGGGGLQVTAVHAEFTSTTATAAGFTVRDKSPVLLSYRSDVLCLIVRSIGEGAALMVDKHNGTCFVKWKAFSRSVSPQTAPFKPAASFIPAGAAP